jgi:hypothetical protein
MANDLNFTLTVPDGVFSAPAAGKATAATTAIITKQTNIRFFVITILSFTDF